MTTRQDESQVMSVEQSPAGENTAREDTSTIVVTEGRRLKFLRDALGMTIAKCISAGKYVLFCSHSAGTVE